MLLSTTTAVRVHMTTMPLLSRHRGQGRASNRWQKCRSAGQDAGDAFLANFKTISSEVLSGGQAQAGCCSGSGQAAADTAQQSGGGCGCNGTKGQEESAAQGVIQAFGQMIGGPEGPGLTRADLEDAFSMQLGETQGSEERFWDVRDVLAGMPSDLVFDEADEDLDGMVV